MGTFGFSIIFSMLFMTKVFCASVNYDQIIANAILNSSLLKFWELVVAKC